MRSTRSSKITGNQYRFKIPHSYDRMAERGATEDDVLRALATATGADLQDNGRHKCTGGVDLDGDDMTVIVELQSDVIIITLF